MGACILSGHSKWSSIKRKKEKIDNQRGKVFTKISKAISIAVRLGGPDPNLNSRLRECILKAKAFNLPNENIEKIIKKIRDDGSELNCESFFYEGYGPGGVAFIVEILTNNKNRAAANFRMYFSKAGGNLGPPGCVSFMFDEKSVIEIAKNGVNEEVIIHDAIEAGAEDLKIEKNLFVVISEKNKHESVKQFLLNIGYEFVLSEISRIPNIFKPIYDKETKLRIQDFIETIENDDDVQTVWCNCKFEN
ncbi:MAG: YebC/PmpR family DNA-binding transcriptional regulator [Firmicutes bacterium]|nr:YebC/PmpR family DNA-binding transcriptional regulator [Bacillota bacterium]